MNSKDFWPIQLITCSQKRSQLPREAQVSPCCYFYGLNRRLMLTAYAILGLFVIAGTELNLTAQGKFNGQNSPQDLNQLNLEQLGSIEVTTVTKEPEQIWRVPAAVFVITQEDIRRSGATSIPEALRLAPGVEVGRIDADHWSVAIRGFAGQFSKNLLVLIDGRSVYTPLFSGVYWDVQNVMLEDSERIEVIRGPGGTIWGANAVDGVINIFTKKASETLGGLLVAQGGNIDQEAGMVQFGGKLKEGADYRVYAKYFNNANLFDLNGQNGADGWHQLRGGFRMDSALSSKDSLMVEGDIATGREGELGFVLPSVTSPGFVTESEQINIANGSLESVWNHAYSTRSNTSLQISFDRHERDDPQ